MPNPRTCSIPGCPASHYAKTWCRKHHSRWLNHDDALWEPPTLNERFWSKVDKDGPVSERHPELGPCWRWTGTINDQGYGTFHISDAKRTHRAHIVAYELLVAPVPVGKHLDHKCHNLDPECFAGSACPHRRCVNPRHTTPATPRENVLSGKTLASSKARQTHCIHDHEFTESNTYRRPNGTRLCRECAHLADLKRGWRRGAERVAVEATE